MNELSRIININKGKGKFKINYEKLKDSLNYEDIFYDEVLKPKCDKYGYEISFNGEFCILTPKEEI